MAIRPDVTIGYAKPKKKARRPTPKPGTQGPARRGAGQPKGPVARPERTTVTVKPRGARHAVTVDTGDILGGRKVPAPKKAKAKKKSFTRMLKEELEGKGVIAHAVGDAAEAIAKHAIIPSTGGGPTVATRLGTGQNPLKRGGSRTATILAPKPVKAPKIVGRTLKDIVNFPAQAIPSTYVPAAALVELARGKPARGKKLLHDLPHTDAGAALITGHPGRALKLAEEHPGFAALEGIGVKGVAGRGAGRVMRAAPKSSRVHQAASTRRASQKGPEGTDLERPRSYSPDVTRKAAQVAVERHQTKRATKLRQDAARTQDPELLAQANRIDPARMSEHEQRKRMDERQAVNETVRRQNRAKVTQEAAQAVKPAKSTATVLHAQGITKANVADLRKYRDELAAEHDNLRPSEQLANRNLRKQIDKAIAGDHDPALIEKATDNYRAVMAPRQQALVERGLVAKEQVEKSPLVPYAVRHMDAKPTEHGPVHADGSPVTPAQIRAHMAEHGVKEPVYVTHAPGQRGAKNFFVSSGKPPQVASPTRTGAATLKGTHDAHPDVLIEGAAKAQGLIDAADGFTATIREFAHKPTLGKLPTRKAADQRARDLYAETGQVFKPIRIQPFAGRQEQLKALLDDASQGADLSDTAMQPVRDALESAAKGEEGPGPWALMPEAAADRFAAHMRALGVGPKAKALQVAGSGFRRTVLATSPSWMAGNVTEATLRAGIARAGPRSYATGKRVVKRLEQLDPKAAQELSARALGGGHFSMAEKVHIRRDSTQFRGDRALEPIARGLGAFWRTPGPKHAAAVWRGWTDIVFRQLNGKLESQFQTALLGRALRDSPLMDEHTLKMSTEAVDQAARGLRNTNEQAALAREVERMYGKYQAFSPDTKWAIATYTPFIAWTINAVKFVTDVLPRDHPATTALIASAEQVTEEWRRDHGLDLFMKGALPGFLQGSIPTGGGGHQRFPFRYTPFGAFGDPLGTVGSAVLPQFSGVLAAFEGQDWKGAKLRKEDGSEADTGDKAKAAAVSFIDATVPIVGQAKRISEKGLGALNPTAVVKPKAKKTGSGRVVGTPEQQIDRLLQADPVQSQIDALLSP